MAILRRGRDYHLYDGSGRRYLDLYQEGGRACLGHRPEGLSLKLKNIISRGVYTPYPCAEEGQMYKALEALLAILTSGSPPPRGACSYYRPESLSYQKLGQPRDPLFEDSSAAFQYWRPWRPWPSCDVVELYLPFPGLSYGHLLIGQALPPGELPSPVIAAGISSILWTLSKQLTELPRTLSLPEPWRCQGPYFRWEGEEEAYDDLFKRALELGILLPPAPKTVGIVPRILHSGDEKALASFFSLGPSSY